VGGYDLCRVEVLLIAALFPNKQRGIMRIGDRRVSNEDLLYA